MAFKEKKKHVPRKLSQFLATMGVYYLGLSGSKLSMPFGFLSLSPRSFCSHHILEIYSFSLFVFCTMDTACSESMLNYAEVGGCAVRVGIATAATIRSIKSILLPHPKYYAASIYMGRVTTLRDAQRMVRDQFTIASSVGLFAIELIGDFSEGNLSVYYQDYVDGSRGHPYHFGELFSGGWLRLDNSIQELFGLADVAMTDFTSLMRAIDNTYDEHGFKADLLSGSVRHFYGQPCAGVFYTRLLYGQQDPLRWQLFSLSEASDSIPLA